MARPKNVILTLDRADVTWIMSNLLETKREQTARSWKAGTPEAQRSYQSKAERAQEIHDKINKQMYPEKLSTEPRNAGIHPMIFKATSHRLSAKWHLEYKCVNSREVEIVRIYRADDEPSSNICWKAAELNDRTIVEITVGEPDPVNHLRHPKDEDSTTFVVTNPKNIFHYE